jgi:hypothetical protein
MENTVTLAPLGHRGPAPRHGDDLRNRLYLLPEPGIVVAVESRFGATRWRCGIVAARCGDRHGHVVISTADLANAHTQVVVDSSADPETWALVWQAWIYSRWLTGHLPVLGRVLAGSLRPPGTLYVDIDTRAMQELACATRLRPPALRLQLTRLVTEHLLTSDIQAPGNLGTYTLTLPTLTAPSTPLIPDAQLPRGGEGS